MRMIDGVVVEQKVVSEFNHFNRSKHSAVWNDGYENGLIRAQNIIRAQPTVTPQPHWISCEERLPSESDHYLVTLDTGEVEVAWLAHPDDYNITEPEWRDIMVGDVVIAWMPLPKPYKGDQGEDR